MMGIVVPETCWAYKKYNKIISGIKLVFNLQLSDNYYLLLVVSLSTRHNTVSRDVTVTQSMFSLSFTRETLRLLR